MGWGRRLSIVLCIALVAGSVFAQRPDNPTTDQKRTIRVGIAPTTNRSRRQVIPTWSRDQLVRELQRLRSDRKSSIVLEVVPLEAASQEDASAEADRKGCQYVVLTTLLDPTHGPSISGGPSGVPPAPVMIGNTSSNQTLAIDFSIIEVGTAQTLTQGTAAAPVEDKNEIRAADEAMRLVAHRIASELRQDRPPRASISVFISSLTVSGIAHVTERVPGIAVRRDMHYHGRNFGPMHASFLAGRANETNRLYYVRGRGNRVRRERQHFSKR